jgi:hypothetical protein
MMDCQCLAVWILCNLLDVFDSLERQVFCCVVCFGVVRDVIFERAKKCGGWRGWIQFL